MQLFNRVGTILILLSLCVSVFYLLDPMDNSWGFEDNQYLKYSPVILSLAALPFFFSSKIRKLKLDFILVTIFLSIVLFGSVFSLLVYGNSLEDSFLGRFICALVFFPSYFMCKAKENEILFFNWGRYIIVFGGFTVSILLLAWFVGFKIVDRPHIYHEEIFIVVSAIGALLFRLKNPFVLLGCVFLISATVFSHKLTGYLCGVSAVALLVRYLYWRIQSTGMWAKVFFHLSLPSFLVVCATAFAFAAFFFSEQLPTGSPGVRMFTYQQRLIMFVENPVWGTWFVGSPMMDVRWMRIPSHSDILDILAFGGFTGFFLFLFPLTRVSVFFGSRMRSVFDRQDGLAVLALSGSVAFFIEMLFNPVWGQPKLATVFWCFVGCLFAKYTSWKYDERVSP